ncbi:unnamed protein product [Phyllotreta striolata]|uniref:Thrombospondin-like N-terminal domain-containing protein n=1 Tax=Phyllotreta striolata TaxID=444603 RepID=A0A9N9TPV5_PHYSR|nr:unnamed protein product [Phyllotreta striolata]
MPANLLPGAIHSISILVTLTFLSSTKTHCSSWSTKDNERQVSIEDSALASQIVFRGSTFVPEEAPARPANANSVAAYFFVKNTYKGEASINDLVTNNFGRINVSFPVSVALSGYKVDLQTVPEEYIIFCNLIEGDVRGVAAVKWSESNDYRVWKTLGWSDWGDWSSCSVSCSGGIQQRIRHCNGMKCNGFNVEQRHCNMFSCEDIINPLAIVGHKSFHPGAEKWDRVPDRPSAWRLRPSSYVWLPSKELFHFAQENTLFPGEFSVFLTVRLPNTTMGTIFGVRSRSRQDAYLSLEATSTSASPETPSTLKVIHASPTDGTDVVRIPARLDDGRWHQLAISFRDSRVVDIYVDCKWLLTEILRSHELDIPKDSDVIIGYLFTGDLEQLTIIPRPDVASKQCEDYRVPITDFQEVFNRFRKKAKGKKTS